MYECGGSDIRFRIAAEEPAGVRRAGADEPKETRLRPWPLWITRLAALAALTCAGLTAPAAAGPSSRTATFDITMKDGRVERIAIHVPATGEDYLVDRFIDDDNAIAAEAEAFQRDDADRGCTPADPDRACRTACAHAENARPFTRLRRRSANGRMTTLWPVEKERFAGRALKFDAGASSASSRDGDCVSPDGRYISLCGYPAPYESERGKTPGIYALTRNLPAVSFRGVASRKVYGEDRYFLFGGWTKGKAHTLQFSWGGDDGAGGPLDDRAHPAR